MISEVNPNAVLTKLVAPTCPVKVHLKYRCENLDAPVIKMILFVSETARAAMLGEKLLEV